jgi:hypothetical protein
MQLFSTTLLIAFAGLMAIGIATVMLRRLGRAAGVDGDYEAQPALLTPAERSFFGVLQHALASDYQLFAKVRLADIIRPSPASASGRRHSAFNRISARHVDFVACDSQTSRIVGVIELDDNSHARSRRQARGDFVDAALTNAGIPVLRVSARLAYSPGQLRAEAERIFRSHRGVADPAA